MITTININRQDIEDTIDKALAEFKKEHSRKPYYLVLGRLAYEALLDMIKLERRPEDQGVPDHYKGLEVAVLEDPPNALSIGCQPD